LERDFGIRKVPFAGRRPARRGRAATTNDRTPAGRLAATGALLAVVVLFMPEGIIPAVARRIRRRRGPEASIREETAEDRARREQVRA